MTQGPNEFERAAQAMKRPTLPNGKLVVIVIATVGTSLAFHLGSAGRMDSWFVGAVCGALGGTFLAFLPYLLRKRRANRIAFAKAWEERKDPFKGQR